MLTEPTIDNIPPLLITIDGPAGAGKTTVSRMLADKLAYRYIDTGALYRGVAYAALNRKIDPKDPVALAELCKGIRLQFVLENGQVRLKLNDEDISERIRTPEITMLASATSAQPVVRERLLEIQRELGREKCAVFEGRDMGTVIFPHADVKFYLTAGEQARAERRYRELTGKATVSLKDVQRDMALRDRNDSSRKLAPLKPAHDAILIDSTRMSLEEVVACMLEHIFNRTLPRPT
jgi:CMP/dCMP kinase